jgi:FKBP12-rapamycin complex-associated protein
VTHGYGICRRLPLPGQINRALTWCDPKDSTEPKRLAAVMLLREMAEQAPAVFNVHVKVSLAPTWASVCACKQELSLEA